MSDIEYSVPLSLTAYSKSRPLNEDLVISGWLSRKAGLVNGLPRNDDEIVIKPLMIKWTKIISLWNELKLFEIIQTSSMFFPLEYNCTKSKTFTVFSLISLVEHWLHRGVRAKKEYVYITKEALTPFSLSPHNMYICYIEIIIIINILILR